MLQLSFAISVSNDIISVSNDIHDKPGFQHVAPMHVGIVFTDKQGQCETRFSLCVQQSAISCLSSSLLCAIFSWQAIICIHGNFP